MSDLARSMLIARGSCSPMKVALGVCGGIAAYKAAEIVRLLQERDLRVQVVMTESAQEFVRPLTFAALSGEKVITGMFSSDAGAEPNIDSAIGHIAVALSIDRRWQLNFSTKSTTPQPTTPRMSSPTSPVSP